jgi:hypothetical protein
VTRCSQTHRGFAYKVTSCHSRRPGKTLLHISYPGLSICIRFENVNQSLQVQEVSPSKGKTIRKAEPIDDRQGRRDLHSKNETGDSNDVDSSSVSAWVKGSAVGNSDSASRQVGAVLKDSKRPCRPTLVSLPPKFVHAIFSPLFKRLYQQAASIIHTTLRGHATSQASSLL